MVREEKKRSGHMSRRKSVLSHDVFLESSTLKKEKRGKRGL